MWRLALGVLLALCAACCVNGEERQVVFNWGATGAWVEMGGGVQRVRVAEEDLQKCFAAPLRPTSDERAKAVAFPPDSALVVYDDRNCGGNSMVIHSSGLYKKVDGDGTRDAGFRRTVGDNGIKLNTVCKFSSCGYSSTAYALAFLGSGGRIPEASVIASSPSQCKCDEAWDNVVSLRLLTKQQLSKNVLF